MPDSSKRIRQTSINAMNNVMFILNSLDKRADPEKHPRLIVIFNDQSRYEGKKSEEIIKNLLAQRFEKNQANKRRSYQQ